MPYEVGRNLVYFVKVECLGSGAMAGNTEVSQQNHSFSLNFTGSTRSMPGQVRVGVTAFEALDRDGVLDAL